MKDSSKFVARLANEEAGLTLVEIIAVIILLGVIIAVFGGGIFSQVEGAKAKLNVAKMDTVAQKLSLYKLQFGKYPAQLKDLVEPSSEVKDSGELFTPLLGEEDLLDVWKNPYLYKTENNRRSFELSTYGEDGKSGGEGAAQDVTKKG